MKRADSARQENRNPVKKNYFARLCVLKNPDKKVKTEGNINEKDGKRNHYGRNIAFEEGKVLKKIGNP